MFYNQYFYSSQSASLWQYSPHFTDEDSEAQSACENGRSQAVCVLSSEHVYFALQVPSGQWFQYAGNSMIAMCFFWTWLSTASSESCNWGRDPYCSLTISCVPHTLLPGWGSYKPVRALPLSPCCSDLRNDMWSHSGKQSAGSSKSYK